VNYKRTPSLEGQPRGIFARSVTRPLYYLMVVAPILVLGSWFAATVWAQSQPSKEYIRIGGRVIAQEGGESLSLPNAPSGPASGSTGTSYSYSTGGATSTKGHGVQYQFNWGDNSNSGWLQAGTTSASHSWSTAGSKNVTAQARCTADTSAVSPLSNVTTVTIH
jgi:hypothetical protein